MRPTIEINPTLLNKINNAIGIIEAGEFTEGIGRDDVLKVRQLKVLLAKHANPKLLEEEVAIINKVISCYTSNKLNG